MIREFALRKPVSRLLVNTPAALGGVGATTSLPPALTLGCGAVGGSATSDNVTPMHLVNIRRVAWGQKEISSLHDSSRGSQESYSLRGDSRGSQDSPKGTASAHDISPEQIAEITRRVMERLNGYNGS